MSNKARNIVIAVMVVVITSLIVGVSYGLMSELGFATDNKISFNQTLKITFQNDNEINVTNSENSLMFSVVNYGTLDMLYSVFITPKNLEVDEIKSIKIGLDGKEYKMNDLEKVDDKYLLYTGAIKRENNSNDAISHKVTVLGENASGSVEVSVSSNVVNDLASDVIASLNYSGNKFGLTEDIMGNVRYVGENPYNYISFNNELWRIIGVFEVTSSLDNMRALRVKIMKDENLAEQAWSDNANLFNNSSINYYLNGDYYESISAKNQIDMAGYKIGEYGEVTQKEQMVRMESNGIDYSSIVSLPSVADYLYARDWMTTGWLLASNANNVTVYYSVLDSGEVGLKKYDERTMVSPVVYLNSTIRIVDGDGSRTNPFVIR